MTVWFEQPRAGARRPGWRVRLLDLAARALGVRFHIDGLPYGSRKPARPAMTWLPANIADAGWRTVLVNVDLTKVRPLPRDQE